MVLLHGSTLNSPQQRVTTHECGDSTDMRPRASEIYAWSTPGECNRGTFKILSPSLVDQLPSQDRSHDMPGTLLVRHVPEAKSHVRSEG
jgi:hypothetical protein